MKTLITYPQTPNEKNSAIEISIRSDVPVPVNSHKKFGCSPVTTTCYRCNQVILSKVRYSAGLLTWILFVVCLFTGCWLGCCLIPFCLKTCSDCDHYCPHCQSHLANCRRL
uniref:LITAF domain-containing protein n=1 Tax=Ditylenchus dipsaci TaxID=166011 RepID=A0A915CZN3_9BILA